MSEYKKARGVLSVEECAENAEELIRRGRGDDSALRAELDALRAENERLRKKVEELRGFICTEGLMELAEIRAWGKRMNDE